MPNNSPNSSIYRAVTNAVLLGLAVNLILGVMKLIGGILGNSFALISDAVNSLGDAFTSVFILFALRVAQLPPDKEHPYGHTKAEAIAGSNVALLIILSALLVGWEAIGRIHLAHTFPPVWTLWLAGFNVVIKECLYHYKWRIGKRTGSSALIANAWDHRSDALCSLLVLVSLGMVRWGGPAWIRADEVAALVVVALIVWSGILLFRNSSSELMDVQAKPEMVQNIRQTADAVTGVKGIEKLRVRKSGLEYFVDIHIEVDQHLSVAEGHHIGHQVKDKLIEQFPTLRDVLVHLEPFPPMLEKFD
jgi:cation diffusion facilitator family transporter